MRSHRFKTGIGNNYKAHADVIRNTSKALTERVLLQQHVSACKNVRRCLRAIFFHSFFLMSRTVKNAAPL